MRVSTKGIDIKKGLFQLSCLCSIVKSRSNEDESWWELASGVGQQTNIIDEQSIEDTRSYKEWTTSNLKRFLQQTARTFATFINSHNRSNAYQLSLKFEPVQS